jgi:hypothetical protein
LIRRWDGAQWVPNHDIGSTRGLPRHLHAFFGHVNAAGSTPTTSYRTVISV